MAEAMKTGSFPAYPDKIGKEKLERLMANPNPKNRFKKGHVGVAGPGRPPGATNVLTRDIKALIREAAEEVCASHEGLLVEPTVLAPEVCRGLLYGA
jgi:hypothetical protein